MILPPKWGLGNKKNTTSGVPLSRSDSQVAITVFSPSAISLCRLPIIKAPSPMPYLASRTARAFRETNRESKWRKTRRKWLARRIPPFPLRFWFLYFLLPIRTASSINIGMPHGARLALVRSYLFLSLFAGNFGEARAARSFFRRLPLKVFSRASAVRSLNGGESALGGNVQTWRRSPKHACDTLARERRDAKCLEVHSKRACLRMSMLHKGKMLV